MRKAYNNEGLIVHNDKFIGISLGYDYCAEHEWGIKGINRGFGIPESNKTNMGVESRSITTMPKMYLKEETVKKKKFAILFTRGYSWRDDNNAEVPSELKNYVKDLMWNEDYNNKHVIKDPKDNILTAWDEKSFAVAVMGDKEVEYLKELHQAFLDNNITIAVVNLRAKNPFAGSSLSLLIKDRIPQETLDLMYRGDKEYYDLHDYEEKIGMKKIIEENGNKDGYKGNKFFCACSPKWIDYNDESAREEAKKKRNTKFNITYWVNYSDNDENYGWYTVEEIREWLTGSKKLIEIRKA